MCVWIVILSRHTGKTSATRKHIAFLLFTQGSSCCAVSHLCTQVWNLKWPTQQDTWEPGVWRERDMGDFAPASRIVLAKQPKIKWFQNPIALFASRPVNSAQSALFIWLVKPILVDHIITIKVSAMISTKRVLQPIKLFISRRRSLPPQPLSRKIVFTCLLAKSSFIIFQQRNIFSEKLFTQLSPQQGGWKFKENSLQCALAQVGRETKKC